MSGHNTGSTEVIDMETPSLTCQSFGTITTRPRAVGGLLQEKPIVCGGLSYSIRQSCHIFGESQTVTMTQARYYAASVVLNSTTMWVIGGYSGSSAVLSTEFITLEKSVPGPSLPKELSFVCAVKYNESQIYVTGGYGGSVISSLVYIFNPLDNFSYIEGPGMNYRRQAHACAMMHFGGSSAIVVTGGYGGLSTSSSNDYLKTVEIYDPSIGQWQMGKKIYLIQ